MTARRAAGALPILLLAALAGAEEVVPCQLQAREGRLVARLALAAAFPEELSRTFGNGTRHVVLVQVGLLPEDAEEPGALFVREIEVRYDVWEEAYAGVVRDHRTPRGRPLRAKSWPELRARLADQGDVELAPLPAAEGTFVLRACVEPDPVSLELLEQTREYIANPNIGVRGGSPSRSIFGSLSSRLFKPPEGGSARCFRTRRFTAREVAPR